MDEDQPGEINRQLHERKISLLIYALAVPLAFVQPRIACAGYVIGAVIWLIPDRRIERTLAQ